MPIKKVVAQGMRWTARMIGALILAFVVLHLAGGGLLEVQDLAPGESLLWGGFVLSLVGFVLLWKWELIGGIFALIGIGLFYSIHFSHTGHLPAGWVFPLFFLPGVLSIVGWLTEHRTTTTTQ